MHLLYRDSSVVHYRLVTHGRLHAAPPGETTAGGPCPAHGSPAAEPVKAAHLLSLLLRFQFLLLQGSPHEGQGKQALGGRRLGIGIACRNGGVRLVGRAAGWARAAPSGRVQLPRQPTSMLSSRLTAPKAGLLEAQPAPHLPAAPGRRPWPWSPCLARPWGRQRSRRRGRRPHPRSPPLPPRQRWRHLSPSPGPSCG